VWEDGRVTGDGKLFRYLQSDNPLIRLRSVEVIGRIQDPQDLPHLLPMLKDDNRQVVAEAVFAIGQMGSADAVTAVLELNKSASPLLQVIIAEALGKIGGEEAVQALTEMLHAFQGSVRGAAALGLARAEDPETVNSLLISMRDGDPQVAWKAIYAMEQVESERVVKAIPPFLKNDNTAVRAYAARTLGKQKKDDKAAVSGLVAALSDPELTVVVNAANALAAILEDKKKGDVVDPLGNVLRKHPSHHARKAAAAALGAIRHKNAKDYLAQSILDKDPGVRAESYKALANVLKKKSLVFLGSGLNDSEPVVRSAALESFGLAGEKDKLAFLIAAAEEDNDTMNRAAAVRALAHFDAEDVTAALVAKVQDTEEDWVVVTEAVTALGKVEAKDAAGALVETYTMRTRREDVDVRLEVLGVLTEMAAPEGRTIALQSLEDSDKRIRERSKQLLEKLGEEPAELKDDRFFHERDFRLSRRKELVLPFGKKTANITTKHGTIEIELFGDDATQTAANFEKLARTEFYDGKNFHRVVPNFVVQGGCPRGDGWGDPGYNIRSEFNQHGYERGYVGIAHAGKDTGGCQFFITLSPQPHLNGRYTIFGKVIRGMDAVDKITVGDTFTVLIRD
jgi:peptidylprolyl isomerase